MCLWAADFDSISDPIMKAKMVALKGINKVMTQGNLGMNPIVINRYSLSSDSSLWLMCYVHLKKTPTHLLLRLSVSGSSQPQQP